MYEKALHCSCPSAMRHVPDWLVTSKMLKDVDNTILNNLGFDELIIWRNGYKQRKFVKKRSTES